MENQPKNEKKLKSGISRRKFLGGAALGAAAVTAGCATTGSPPPTNVIEHASTVTTVPSNVVAGSGQTPPSEKLNVAGIGVGGRGGGDINDIANCKDLAQIVALCDVDWKQAEGTMKKFPDAKRYWDYRKMLEEMCKDIDAVSIGTPDHIHCPVALAAMELGKHVYVEKPLASSIAECRAMQLMAKRQGLVTQMGNQGHAGEGLRQSYEYIHDGAIGTIREIHGWSDRPIWPQGIGRPTDVKTPPDTLNWDLWLGPVLHRPYHDAYAPFRWRGWWDFGAGAMGDMAVHNVDPAFWVLDLGAPYAVEAESDKVNNETFPNWETITYYFKAKGDRPEVKMIWFDGKKDGKPNLPPVPKELEPDRKLDGNGIIWYGDKGAMMAGSHASPPRIIPESKFKEYERPAKTQKRSPGHHKEWVQACLAGKPEDSLSNFDYAGPFTEALLVGMLAVRTGQRVEWDSENLRSPNVPEADRYVNKHYRNGWGMSIV